MKIAVLGATGRLGKVLTRYAIDAGHDVRAFVRSPENLGALRDEVEVVKGDLGDPSSLDEAVAGVDAVLSCLGPRDNDASLPALFREGARQLVASMSHHGVRRAVVISGAGARLTGDELSWIHRAMYGFARIFIGNAIRCNEETMEVLHASDLEWVAVRPGRITDAPSKGPLRAHATRPVALDQSRNAVAEFMLAQLEKDEWLGTAPFV